MSTDLPKPTENTARTPFHSTAGHPQTSTSRATSNSSTKPQNTTSPTLMPLFEIWDRARAEILTRKDAPEHTIGLPKIDEMLWGFRRGILYTIGARTSHGKTSFAVHLLRSLADSGLRVLYFTMETSREQLIEKLFCNVCRVNSLDLLHGKARDVFQKRVPVFTDWADRAKVLIDDKYGYSFPELLEVINTVGADFVIVDYIQMISSKGFRTKTDAIEEYVRKFAELASTKKFGAIIISQINRSGVDEPTMSKFKWAGVLEEHSRVAVVLSYNKEKGVYKVNIEKNAFGQTGDFQIKFEPEYSSFRELTEEEEYDIEMKKKISKRGGGLYGCPDSMLA